MKHHQILVIGAGTGGIMVSAQLKRSDPSLDICILDPAETHYYQPAWTLVGANTYSYEKTGRPMKELIPKGVRWVKEAAGELDPENNKVITAGGDEITYDVLVVSPGLVMKPELVKGLSEVLDKGVVCSNYTDPRHTWDVLKNFKGGTALFTQPNTAIKCGGAPQKIMYLADDHYRRAGVRDKTTVVFATPGTTIFGVPEIKKTLMEVVDRKDIYLRFGHILEEIDGENQIAWYKLADHFSEYNSKSIEIEQDGDRVGIRYDMMHLAPPQGPPEFISKSPLADSKGWLDVDRETLQQKTYANVFGIGDIANLPTAKTGAAIRKQAPIVVENVLRVLEHKTLTDKHYNGYSSCPLITGYGKMVLAEFDYDQNFTPDPELRKMLIFDSSREHWRLWMLKKYILPYLYWNRMMKGRQV